MKRTDFTRKMTAAGWKIDRQGKHEVWVKKGHHFSVPRHKEISDGTVRAWERLNAQLDEEA